MDFKKRVVNRYDGLFSGSDNGDGGGDFSASATFSNRWGWYQSVYQLAQGDVRRFDAVTELPLHQCLTYLMFEKEKVTLENDELKRRMKQR